MKRLIIANWKMNPQTLEEAKKLMVSWQHRLHFVADHVEVVICPPFVFLPSLHHHVAVIKLGAQNMSWIEEGALTGEVSAIQLKHWNVSYVILGHSERRLYLGETDSIVNEKVKLALYHKLTPILCLGGEQGADRDQMQSLVTKQFAACTKDVEDKNLHKIVYVYEPTWAISTMNKSRPETGEHAAEMVDHIYTLLEHRIGKAAKTAKVLYGGTVNKLNVHEYAKFPQIDGALVGAASLDSENFWQIIKEFHRESLHRS